MWKVFNPDLSDFRDKAAYLYYRQSYACGLCKKYLNLGDVFDFKPFDKIDATMVRHFVVHKKCWEEKYQDEDYDEKADIHDEVSK